MQISNIAKLDNRGIPSLSTPLGVWEPLSQVTYLGVFSGRS